MRPGDVIRSLEQRGITLEPVASGLKVSGVTKLTERELAALRVHKGAILKALAADATVSTDPASPAPVEASTVVTAPLPNRTEPPEPGSTAPFNQQALDAVKAGAGCWVWSGVLNEWLFWVRDDERKAKATSRGIDPGCIWMLAEITGVQGMPPEGLRDVAKIKRQFGGTVQPGEVPARWRDALQPLEPVVAEQDANNQIVECRTCLRYGPRDHYCGHKLRHIREGEGPICSGKGYSPKGEPWKEDRS